ncbi:glutamate--cysteine ligase [Nocardia ninae]|uniref:Putative glutamate--cysteine ligase 2 n=1 Tax=Nocardia ninae NBRC 108245 TaxID=1210091 RepID=A0A511MG07_9NOCA|nr:glutamate--cysteine ligase [Nocardia ninae]GEM39604.1 putative glutamate--cysteine ligase 2-3 [Nocardia ninae NBRC 108245]
MDAAAATVGVEEEFLLADPETGAPAAKNVEVAHTAAELGIDLQLELTRCQVETSTGVHTDSAELAKELRDLRCGVAACAEKNGALLLAVAIPPTVPNKFPVTDTPRYQRIAESFGMLAHEQGLCGCHVHVAVPDRDTALQVSNFLRPWLPLLLALTANSAIYRGADTGFASWRSILWRRWPSAGPPPYFESARDYDAMVAIMLSSGSILDKKMVYWDVRPSSTFPTVEIRVSDVPATTEETVLLATLVRAAVLTARMSLAQHRSAPEVSAEMLRAAYWKAARTGLDGDLLDPMCGRIVPARDLIAELVDYVGPALDELGDRRLVTDSLTAVLARGNGAMRQLNAFRQRREVGDVVAELASATLAGCRSTPRATAT